VFETGERTIWRPRSAGSIVIGSRMHRLATARSEDGTAAMTLIASTWSTITRSGAPPAACVGGGLVPWQRLRAVGPHITRGTWVWSCARTVSTVSTAAASAPGGRQQRREFARPSGHLTTVRPSRDRPHRTAKRSTAADTRAVHAATRSPVAHSRVRPQDEWIPTPLRAAPAAALVLSSLGGWRRCPRESAGVSRRTGLRLDAPQ
jgi:hypothetical protein